MSMMGLHTSADAGIGNETQSVLAAVDDQLRPAPESQDIMMSDQSQSEGDIQQAPMEIANDVEVITKDEFDNPQLTHERKIIRDIRANNKRLVKTVKKQKGTIEQLQTQLDIEGDQLNDAAAELEDCQRALQKSEDALQNTKDQLAATKRELRKANVTMARSQGANKEMQSLRKELATAQRDLKSTQDILRSQKATDEDLQEALAKLAASQEELSACKDDSFVYNPWFKPLIPTLPKKLIRYASKLSIGLRGRPLLSKMRIRKMDQSTSSPLATTIKLGSSHDIVPGLANI